MRTEIYITDKETVEIYTTGKSSMREITEEIAKNLCYRIQQIEACSDIKDLKGLRSLDFNGSSLIVFKDWKKKDSEEWRVEAKVKSGEVFIGKLFKA